MLREIHYVLDVHLRCPRFLDRHVKTKRGKATFPTDEANYIRGVTQTGIDLNLGNFEWDT
jgi:hypothetical protein